MTGHTSRTRRQFLFNLGLLGVGCVVPSTIPVLAKTIARPQDNADIFSFVDEQGLGPELDPARIEADYFPLHAEQTQVFPEFGQQQLDWMRNRLKSEYNRAGLQWKEHYELVMTAQHYGVSYSGSQAARLLAYCESVQNYLYGRLRGLYETDIRWSLLNSPGNSQSDLNRRFQGLVGRYTYRIFRLLVWNTDYTDTPCLMSAETNERALNYINEDGDGLAGVIYIIPGRTSLLSPFSEIMHLTLHEPARSVEHYLKSQVSSELARQRAIVAGETVNEATAVVLSMEYLKENGRSDRLPIVEYMAGNLSRRLPELNYAIRYIRKQGVQSSIDQFIEDPVSFISWMS